jgi:hypothetical protein
MPDSVKPYLTAAFLCEHVLQEKDGVVSAVRIVDIFYTEYPYQDIPEGKIPATIVKGLLTFKGGPGEYMTRIEVVDLTTQESQGRTEMPVPLKGGSYGYNIILKIPVALNTIGRYGINVEIDGEQLIQIPFEVKRKPQPESPLPPSETK